MKATSNEKIQEHLCEMMERLLDDDLFQDVEKGKSEIAKAQAMSSLVTASIEMQELNNQRNQTMLQAIKVFTALGYSIDEMKLIGVQFGERRLEAK